MTERHRQTDGPAGARYLASKPSGLEPGTRTEEAWYWRGWQRGRDGDARIPHKSPQKPSEEGAIPWEEPGPPECSSSLEYTRSSGRPNVAWSRGLPWRSCDIGHETLCHPDAGDKQQLRRCRSSGRDTDPTTLVEWQSEPEPPPSSQHTDVQ